MMRKDHPGTYINGRQVPLRMCKSELAALILWTQFMKSHQAKTKTITFATYG